MTEIRLDEVAIRELLTGPQGPVVKMVRRDGLSVLNRARALVPVDTGALRASLQMSMSVDADKVECIVGSGQYYAGWVHNGTGIYGPRHQMIRPVSAKVMAWRSRSNGRMVFARRTRGMKGTFYLTRALQLLTDYRLTI